MRHSLPRSITAILLPLALALGASCATAAREHGGTERSATGSGTAPRGYADADVAFMQGMIAHHAQALVMTDLVPDRAGGDVIRRMAHRIELSQVAEIARMRRWLERRGEPVPEEHPHDAHMPGMLTDEQLERLGQTTGDEFDRLFLELMIQHHEGALVMVNQLRAVPGAGREPELFMLISHIDADQRAEIARMRGMLSTTPQGGTE